MTDRKTISFATAARMFGVEASRRVPRNLTRSAQAVYRKIAIEGLAYQAGYHIRIED